MEQMIRWVLCDLRIPCLTVYALSLENLSNRRPEVLPVPPLLPLLPSLGGNLPVCK